MEQVDATRAATINTLLDARAKCVYHGRGWRMLESAVFHLFEAWLQEA